MSKNPSDVLVNKQIYCRMFTRRRENYSRASGKQRKSRLLLGASRNLEVKHAAPNLGNKI